VSIKLDIPETHVSIKLDIPETHREH
jgi:hypothetical protein